VLFLACLVLAPDAFAQVEPHDVHKAGKTLRARRTLTPPVIDGRLDDRPWEEADTATGFVQRDPDNGKPMTDATTVRVAFDDTHLYVAVQAIDSQPSLIASGMARRDEVPATDQITIGFDPRHDHQTAYAFATNPSAWQSDYAFYDDQNRDPDYDAVWNVRTEITERGWTAEFRVPFSQMRFTSLPGTGQVWGFSISREIKRKGEVGAWVARPRGERGEVSFYGHLVFDDALPSPRRLELAPYSVMRHDRESTSGDVSSGVAAGMDLRAGIGTAFTLAATVNPDFGQVEQDPAVLNLTVFETFFPERRPFFTEDSRTFVPPYSQMQLFHSRRIGRTPGSLVPSGTRLVDAPHETTILGAAKVTGKRSGWTFGALSAVTSREYGSVESTIAGDDGSTELAVSDRLIEPATSYNVIRVQKDILGGTSNIGGIATGVVREQLQDAFTGGVDYNLRWDRNRSGVNGSWAVTRAPGAGGVQTSGGGVTDASFSRKHLNATAHYEHFGRDFRINDIGFFRARVNRHNVNSGVEVGTPDPWKMLRSVWVGTGYSWHWTDEGLPVGGSNNGTLNVRFLNFWQVSANLRHEREVFDDLDTRGGPPILRPSVTTTTYTLTSDPRKAWTFNVSGSRGRQSAGGRAATLSAGVLLRASARLQASITSSHETRRDQAQWITNRDVTSDGAIDHVYGTLHRDVMDLTFRGTFAFTRDLTLQAYAQPFVAVGDYVDIRRLARPKSYEFEPVALPFDADFNRKSLRGNVVMRWEYRPGSTLFAVWSLSQEDLSRPGEFRPLRDLRSAFGANANHVLMVKASYWINL
jgi:hypothetical protein